MKTHKFEDKLGGTFTYLDEPGRLDTLLAADKKRHYRKGVTQGEIDIRAQADWYLTYVKKNNIKKLVFWPLKANMRSLSNEFQYLVMKGLDLPYSYRASQMDHLHELRKQAVKAGYVLTEYDSDVDDY